MPRIEVDNRDLVSLIGKGNGDMHGGRGFSGAAFLVRKNDMMCFAICHLFDQTPF